MCGRDGRAGAPGNAKLDAQLDEAVEAGCVARTPIRGTNLSILCRRASTTPSGKHRFAERVCRGLVVAPGCKMSLLKAAKRGSGDAVRVALAAGADVDEMNEKGTTALIQASIPGHIDVVNALLDAGADVNHVDECGDTALQHACWYGNDAVVNALLAAGANVHRTNGGGQTMLMVAMISKWQSPAVVKALLKAGADANAVDDYGCTALKIAMRSDYQENVDLIQDAVRAAHTRRLP